MPLFRRHDIPKLLTTVREGEIYPIYLLFGERYLCRRTAEELTEALLPEQNRREEQLQQIDGEEENVGRTLTLLRTYSLFPGRRIIQINDSRLLYSKGVARTLWDKATRAWADKQNEAAADYLGQFLGVAGLTPADSGDTGLDGLPADQWRRYFGFAKPQQELKWADELLAGDDENGSGKPKKQGNDPASLFTEAYEKGIPSDNILILLAEAVDKRKTLYKFIQKRGAVLDLTVDGGGGANARRDRKALLSELVRSTLADFNKTMDARTLDLLLERVGFHPVAVVMETEKAALYTGDRKKISREDIEDIIGRTREEALYELTAALSNREPQAAFRILNRLREDGVHSLAILATLRNHFRKLLLIRAFQELREPAYKVGMNFPAFQKHYLPALKSGREEWNSLLWRLHPYALYSLFQQAARFTRPALLTGLREVLAAEYRIKGSMVPVTLTLDNLLLTMLNPAKQKQTA